MRFAIDRLRSGHEAAPPRPPKPPCPHPFWREEGDGHGHNSWTCTTCRHNQWIAPWVMRSTEGDRA